MTFREQIKEWLCERGIKNDEAEVVLDLTLEAIKETEAYEMWDRDISEVTVSHPETTDNELQQVILSVLWTAAKNEVRKVLYFRMEQLAKLIIEFK